MTEGRVGAEEGARTATEADLEILVAMAQVARQAVADQRGGDLWIHHHVSADVTPELFTGALRSDDHTVVVGHIDNDVVGYALVLLVELNDGRKMAKIDELFVLPDARGVGVGEKVLLEVMSWARHHGCFGVDSLALPGDRGTKNFFETFGMKARSILVHSALPDLPETGLDGA